MGLPCFRRIPVGGHKEFLEYFYLGHTLQRECLLPVDLLEQKFFYNYQNLVIFKFIWSIFIVMLLHMHLLHMKSNLEDILQQSREIHNGVALTLYFYPKDFLLGY